jgi:hypothetical protein
MRRKQREEPWDRLVGLGLRFVGSDSYVHNGSVLCSREGKTLEGFGGLCLQMPVQQAPQIHTA